MKRVFVVALMVLVLAYAWEAIAQGDRVDIVVDGNPVGLSETESTDYTQGDGYIEQGGQENYLNTGYPIEEGDFTIYWEMSWRDPHDISGNTIYWGSKSFHMVVFASGPQQIFRLRNVESHEYLDFGNFDDFVSAGEKFTFAIKSRDGYWSYWINGEKIADGEEHNVQFFIDDPVSIMGIRPFRNQVRIYNWFQFPYYLEESTVPELVVEDDWLTIEEAQAALESAGLTLGTIQENWSETVPAGMVISQSVHVGSIVLPGTAVDIIISRGPSPLPVGGLAALGTLIGLSAAGGVVLLRRRIIS